MICALTMVPVDLDVTCRYDQYVSHKFSFPDFLCRLRKGGILESPCPSLCPSVDVPFALLGKIVPGT